MITGELKNRIDSIWENFWTGGLTNTSIDFGNHCVKSGFTGEGNIENI